MNTNQPSRGPLKLGTCFSAARMLGSVITVGAAGAASASQTRPDATSTQTVTVLTAVGPDYNWQQMLIPSFEKATGIKVNYDAIPEASIATKLQVDQEARNRRPTYFEDPEPLPQLNPPGKWPAPATPGR